MKKILFALYILTLSLSCNGQNKEHKTYYDNGQILEDTYFNKEGKLTGEGKAYFKNGQLQSIGKYDNGKMIGNWKQYFDNGKLKIEGSYTEGKQSGSWTYY